MSYLQAPGNVLWLTASAGWVFRSELDNCAMSRVLGIFFLFCWRRNTYYWEGRIIFLSSISIFLWKTPSRSLITLSVQMFNAFLVRMSKICWWFSPVVSCFLNPLPPVHEKKNKNKKKRFDCLLWGMAQQLGETAHFNFKVSECPKSPQTPKHNRRCCRSSFQTCSLYAAVERSFPPRNWHGSIQEKTCWHLVIHSTTHTSHQTLLIHVQPSASVAFDTSWCW